MPNASTDATPKPGRNDLCPCGSGKKFKRCCGALDLAGEDPASRFFGFAAVAAGLMLVGGILVWTKALVFDEDTQPKKVWSAEHGHYHNVGGEGSGTGPGPGKVWNEEHGHYHDAASPPPPAAGETPVRGALDGLRASELDAARDKVAGGTAD